MENKKKLIVIDSNSIIHRAYHALPPLTTKRGELVNAVYGFLLAFFKAIKDFQPDFVAAAFDLPAPTFRHIKYKEYKAKRPPAPDNLYSQIPIVKEILESLGVPIFEKEGFEADDIVGTVANLSKTETVILSGDLDNLQLVNALTKVYFLRRGIKDAVLYDANSVKERFSGLVPGQLIDYKALRGDPSDNIPGVLGVGEKTAADLILKFGSLENLYEKLERDQAKEIEIRPKIKEALLKYKDQAFLSKELVLIQKNAPIDFDLEKCSWGKHDKEKITQIFKKYEFYSLLGRFLKINEKESKETVGENLRLW